MGALAVWGKLGASLQDRVSSGQRQLERALAEQQANGVSSSSSSSVPNQEWARSSAGDNARGASPAGTRREDTSLLTRLTREYPVATALTKEAAMVTLETLVPVVGVVNAARTLADDKASGWQKAGAVVQIAAAAVPPLAAGIKVFSRGAKVANAVSDITRAATSADHAADVGHAASTAAKATHNANDAARAAERASELSRASATAPATAESLRRKLSALENAQKGATRARTLPDGRVRSTAAKRRRVHQAARVAPRW